MKTKMIGRNVYLLLIIVVLVWGLSWPLNKLGLEYIPSLWFASLRLIIATGAMFVIVCFLKKMHIPGSKDWPLILALGVFQIGFFILFINLGLDYQSSSRAAILVYTTPLWVMPMAIFFFKEPNSFLKWFGFFLGIIGIIIMLNPKQINWANKNSIYGILFLMGASLSCSISILCAKYMKWYKTPIELIFWQLLIGTIIVLGITLMLHPYPAIKWNLTSIFCIAYTAIVATALGFWGMTILSKELPATMTSVGFLGVPVSGVVFSILILGEKLELFLSIAMIFIISGLLCVVYAEKK